MLLIDSFFLSIVFTVLATLKSIFNECLENCRVLTQDALIASMNRQDLDNISADSLIYDHAIQMAKSAATEELIGDMEVVSFFFDCYIIQTFFYNKFFSSSLKFSIFLYLPNRIVLKLTYNLLFLSCFQCLRKYQTAQILLHSLSQQTSVGEDKGLLSRYKDAVEKRLFHLHREGYVIPMDTLTTP